MSLITRCPACETMFKVVPDQLRISEGWVRCGQCSEIFNASQHLLTTDTTRAPAAPPGNTQASPLAAQSAPATTTLVLRAAEAPSVAQAPTTTGTPAVEPAPALGPPAEAAAAAASKGAPDRYQHESVHAPQEPRWTESPAAPAIPAPRFVLPDDLLHRHQASAITQPEPFVIPTENDADVSFMRKGEAGTSFWSRRPVRIVLFLLAIALGAALVAQVLLQERNRITQLEPATRPAFAALCKLARCELGPLQQIETIIIESSSFGRLRADNYRLAFSLRNTAPVGVAMPAIELSLTDAQDQALIRRVLLPAEFGAAAASLAAESEWSSALTLSVRPTPNTERIAGYRVLAFYP